MQVNIEDVGPCKKKLNFEVPGESVRQELDKSYQELLGTAQVPGFRQGHAPRKLIENRFGKTVKEEVKNRLIGTSYDEAIKEHKLRPLGDPDIIEASIEFDPEKGLRFSVECEVVPAFALPEYKGLELTRPATDVPEEELKLALDNLRRSNAIIEPVEGAAQAGDVPVVDCVIRCEGEEIQRVEDRQFSLSDDNWLGGLDRSFWRQLEGKGAGETVTAEVTLPQGYAKEAYRGKTATISVTIKDVKRPKLPELDEEFAKDLLFESLEDLKKEVGERLKAAKDRRARQELADQVTEKLVSSVSFDLPAELLKRQAERLALRQKLDLTYRGVPADEVEKVAEKLIESSAKQSERDLRVFFVLRQIAEQEKLEVSDVDLEARVAELARMRGERPAQLHERLQQEGELEALRGELLDEKAIGFLIDNAKVTGAGTTDAEPAAADAESKTETEDKEES